MEEKSGETSIRKGGERGKVKGWEKRIDEAGESNEDLDGGRVEG